MNTKQTKQEYITDGEKWVSKYPYSALFVLKDNFKKMNNTEKVVFLFQLVGHNSHESLLLISNLINELERGN